MGKMGRLLKKLEPPNDSGIPLVRMYPKEIKSVCQTEGRHVYQLEVERELIHNRIRMWSLEMLISEKIRAECWLLKVGNSGGMGVTARAI